MEELYIVTGATGHLGGTIVRLLRAQGAEVRGLLLPGEQPPQGDGVAYYPGDVRDEMCIRDRGKVGLVIKGQGERHAASLRCCVFCALRCGAPYLKILAQNRADVELRAQGKLSRCRSLSSPRQNASLSASTRWEKGSSSLGTEKQSWSSVSARIHEGQKEA